MDGRAATTAAGEGEQGVRVRCQLLPVSIVHQLHSLGESRAAHRGEPTTALPRLDHLTRSLALTLAGCYWSASLHCWTLLLHARTPVQLPHSQTRSVDDQGHVSPPGTTSAPAGCSMADAGRRRWQPHASAGVLFLA